MVGDFDGAFDAGDEGGGGEVGGDFDAEDGEVDIVFGVGFDGPCADFEGGIFVEEDVGGAGVEGTVGLEGDGEDFADFHFVELGGMGVDEGGVVASAVEVEGDGEGAVVFDLVFEFGFVEAGFDAGVVGGFLGGGVSDHKWEEINRRCSQMNADGKENGVEVGFTVF